VFVVISKRRKTFKEDKAKVALATMNDEGRHGKK
jgi:hypothetical protein